MYNHVTQEKCSFCLEKKQHIQNFRYLCNDCFQLLRPAKLKTNCLVSLYEYTAELRYILLQAKTCGDKFAISCLVELVSKNIYTQLLLEQADFIMPAPSSLWSRLRGKTDFTWFLVRALAQKNNLERLYPQRSFYWNWNKRSKLERSGYYPLESFHSPSKRYTVLLVDDVITTGHTLHMVGRSISAYYRILYLTLANSRNYLKGDKKR